MTAPSSIDPAHFLHEQLDQASPDLLRQMLTGVDPLAWTPDCCGLRVRPRW